MDFMNDFATILLAEDQEQDVILMQKAFQKTGIPNPLKVVRDGQEAINYLAGCGEFSARAQYPLPVLMLLDLKMPGMDGFDVLAWIRTQPYLAMLRVVVLTTSDLTSDVQTAYELGACSFLTKPRGFIGSVEIARQMTQYWLQTNVTAGPSPHSRARQAHLNHSNDPRNLPDFDEDELLQEAATA
jgi:CheY-like chemotaxis protein